MRFVVLVNKRKEQTLCIGDFFRILKVLTWAEVRIFRNPVFVCVFWINSTLTWDLPCYPNTYSRVRWLFGTRMRSFKAVYVFLLSPASLGCPGGASRVVRGQSHAGKLDRRMHRLLFWLQTQGKSLLCPLFTFDLSFFFFQLSIVFSKCPIFLSCFCLPLFFWDRFQQRSKISPFSFALSAWIIYS